MRAFQILMVFTACVGMMATKAAVGFAQTPAPSAESSPAYVVPTWKWAMVAALERHKRYPDSAQSRREQGVAQVFFSIDRQGRLLESRVVRSSGSDALDEEALALLRRAEPFPPPPSVLTGEHVDLTVPIRFNLTGTNDSKSPIIDSSLNKTLMDLPIIVDSPLTKTLMDLAARPAKPLFLSLKSDLTLTLGNDPVARDALGSAFDAATGGNKDATIFLRADPTIPYGEVTRIVSLLREAGYVKISLVEPPAFAEEQPRPRPEKKQFTRFVASGTNQRIDFFSDLNPDCSTSGNVNVRVTKQPQHGTVEIFPQLPKRKHPLQVQRAQG